MVTIVDGMDGVIGSIARPLMRLKGSIYRVTYILIFNDSGLLLVQKRTESKDQYPGRLDLAAGGVVAFNEGYEESAQRELFEELGSRAELVDHGKAYFEDRTCEPVNRNWGRIYSCVDDGPFRLQPSEVSEAQFMDIDTALALPPDQVTPDTRQALITYLL